MRATSARLSRAMSLRAKIEAVIYAAEEPVTLAQLAAIFAAELPRLRDDSPAPWSPEEQPTVLTLLEEGLGDANSFLNPGNDIAEVAMLTGLQEQEQHDPAAAEAEAKRAARQREREVRDRLKDILEQLIEDYATGDRGMEIREVAGGYRIATKPEYHDAVRSFVKSLKPPMKLSLQALETLAVIAYKQPVTAPEVSEIRGVDSGGVLGSLVSRKLITTAGRKQVIGRPILYKTTREFLLRFGLKDLNELPSIEEFEKLAGDMEIGEEEAMSTHNTVQEDDLPFEGSSDADLQSVEANAGEPGLAVEAAETTAPQAEPSQPPEVVVLQAEHPETPAIEGIEVTPATHPTVPLQDLEENNGRNT